MAPAATAAQPRLRRHGSVGRLVSYLPRNEPRMSPRTFALPALALLLAACAPEPVVPTAPMAMEGVRLTLEARPQSPVCDPAEPYVVRVRWEAKDWPDPRFDFHLERSDGQLWARHNSASGEQDSGPWARPGLFFVMVDRETRRVAAATPVPPLICPPA